MLLVTGLTLVGEGLNETLNPTLRRRRLLPVVMPPRTRTVPSPAAVRRSRADMAIDLSDGTVGATDPAAGDLGP